MNTSFPSSALFFVAGFLYRLTDHMLFKPIGRWFDRRRYNRIKYDYQNSYDDVNLCYGPNYMPDTLFS
ncbi:MAG: hypothetical protein WAK31_03965 [Chthoniobacterales bacterium]